MAGVVNLLNCAGNPISYTTEEGVPGYAPSENSQIVCCKDVILCIFLSEGSVTENEFLTIIDIDVVSSVVVIFVVLT